VRAALERDGVRFELGARLSRVARRGDGQVLAFERTGETGQAGEVVADEILLALGRVPNVEGLGLEAAGVACDARRGVEVDDRLRTTSPRVFAAGDVAGGYQFTHAADAMARIVIKNAFFFGRARASDLCMSWCTYTDPEVAHVGLYEGEEERAGCALATLRMDFDAIDRSRLEGETEGFAKVVYERKSGRLRGATAVGAHAGELIGSVLLAVQRRLKATDLSSIIHPYPTAASVWARLGDRARAARLTPRVAGALRRVIAWRR
jgi:pyruvate/2-oxoglutarate dehydrogenase complex dihydrolipoamide dehydrogenase (E3) component